MAKVELTEEIAERLKRDFANTPNDVIAHDYGVSGACVSKWARKLHLAKSREYMTRIKQNSASYALLKTTGNEI